MKVFDNILSISIKQLLAIVLIYVAVVIIALNIVSFMEDVNDYFKTEAEKPMRL